MDVEQDFQLATRVCSSLTTFDEAWGLPCLRGRFDELREFCDRLASVFPNTAPAVSDLSLLKFRKAVFTRLLTDFLLESCFQCKQAADLLKFKQ